MENSNLARLPGKGREELYNDGLHLSKKGLYTMETNIIMAMHKVKPGLSSLDVHIKKSPAVKPENNLKKAASRLSGGHNWPPPGYLGGPGQVGGQGGHHHQQHQQQQQQYYQQQQYWAPEQWNSYGHPQFYNNNHWGGW